MGPASKQDVQSIVETSRSRLQDQINRLAQKQDIQALTECVKNLLNVHLQNQQLLKQAEYQRTQLIRRAVALEARLVQVEQLTRYSSGTLNKVAQAANNPRPVLFTAPTQPAAQVQGSTSWQPQYA